MTQAALSRSLIMIKRKTTATLALATAALGSGLATATPASAGGIGDILSPAFGTTCGNHGSTHATGVTTHTTGAANGNLAGLPIGSPLNQCGGADLPLSGADLPSTCEEALKALEPATSTGPGTVGGILGFIPLANVNGVVTVCA
ncbi:hypothetical protein [Streptomyces sp. H72]